MYQLSEVRKKQLKQNDKNPFWGAIKQVFMDKQNQLMKARIKQNLLTSDIQIYRDIDTEIKEDNVKQWSEVCTGIKTQIQDQKQRLAKLEELIEAMATLSRPI